KYVYVILIGISLVFLTNYFLFDGRIIILVTYAEFLLKSFSLFLIGSFLFSTKYLKKYFAVFSLINFVSLSGMLLLGFIASDEYMRFGYALLPTLLFSIYALKNSSHKVFWLFIAASSFIMILFYGSRGPLLAVALFLFIVIFADLKVHFLKKFLA